MAKAKIVVYTKNGCPQCQMTKEVLDNEGIEYEVINVEEDSEAMDYIVNTLQLRSLPVVVVGGQDVFTGFRPDKLKELKRLK